MSAAQACSNSDERLQALEARLAALEQSLATERARRAYLEQILANVNDAIIVIGAGSQIVEWNAAAERIYGWAAHEALGCRLSELLAPRYLDGSTNESARATVDEHGVWTGLVAQRHRDGHDVMIESAVRYLRAADGQVIGLVGINRDASARLAAEEALRQSEAQLRAFFESAPEAHFLLDPQLRILAFNQVAAQQVQSIWQRELAQGDSILAYANPADREAFSALFARCLRGEALRHERELTFPSGRTSWYEVAYSPIVSHDEGRVRGVAFSILDVTARKQTELTLAHREAQLAGIIDSAMDAIITVDADQRIVRFNRAAERVFGCPTADVLGHTLDRFIPPEARVAHRQHIPAFGNTGVTRRSMHSPGVLEAVRLDGSHFPIEASISQITVEGERFYTVILRDISQRKELEAQLLHAQKLESIGQLAGGVAHDFNNLLTVIGGITDLMRDELPVAHPLQSDLAEVSLATQRATALTRQLLAFARRQILAPRVIDLNALVRETAPLIHRLIGENIAVALDLQRAPLPIRADPNQIQQVLVNLAVNARDAMPDGGQLHISTQLVEVPQETEEPWAVPGSFVVRIVVQDTGSGIPPEVQARIFEPFFTTKAPGHGTGLGLATSYGIVAQHNGHLEVNSQLGEGATFTITLPAVDETPEARGQQLAAAGMPHGSETVLLVEDEVAVREFVGRVLRGLGYTVLSARHGLDALQIARRDTHFDLLLTDIVMPELSGIALATRLKAMLPGLRVVFMSGYAEHATLAEETIAQMNLIHKPFTGSALARLVRAVLDDYNAAG